MAAFAHGGGDAASPAELKKSHVVEKTDMEKSLAASEGRLVDVEGRVQKFENNRDTLDDLVTKADKTKAYLKRSEEQVHFHMNKVSEQRKEFAEKDAASNGYRRRVFILEKDLASVSTDVTRLSMLHTVDKNLL